MFLRYTGLWLFNLGFKAFLGFLLSKELQNFIFSFFVCKFLCFLSEHCRFFIPVILHFQVRETLLSELNVHALPFAYLFCIWLLLDSNMGRLE